MGRSYQIMFMFQSTYMLEKVSQLEQQERVARATQNNWRAYLANLRKPVTGRR
jgi:hypothetical protein